MQAHGRYCTSDAFVCDVKVAPAPQCVMMFDFQLQDLVRFFTDM